jgi:hypothetical protein
VDGSNGEFVFMDWGNWELVDVDGSNGQVVTLGLETGIIGEVKVNFSPSGETQ